MSAMTAKHNALNSQEVWSSNTSPGVHTLFLYDPSGNGHHPMYLRLMSKALLELGHRVVVFGHPDAFLLDQASTTKPEHYDCLQVFYPKFSTVKSSSIRLFLNGWRCWRLAHTNIRRYCEQNKIRPDLVFFPYLDSLLAPLLPARLLDLIFPYPWAGLYLRVFRMRTRTGHKKKDVRGPIRQILHKVFPKFLEPIKEAVLRRIIPLLQNDLCLHSPRCRAVALLEEDLVEPLGRELDKPVFAFPDFTDEHQTDPSAPLIKQLRQAAGERKIVCIIGSLAERKGLFDLLRTAQSLEGEPICFAFIGQLFLKPHSEKHPLLVSPPSNCFFYFERVASEATFNAVIEASDIVFAAYNDFRHSSNMLIKAALFRKPIIVSDGFLMAKRTRDYELGRVVAEADITQLRQAVLDLCSPEGHEAWAKHSRCDDYCRAHSIPRLKAAFEELLRLALRNWSKACGCSASQHSGGER